ncbi:hypothetical protein GCM10009552_39060 [Rothia nasimurium]
MGRQVVALAQPHAQASPHGIAGNAHAVDATTDHQNIDLLDHHALRLAGGETSLKGHPTLGYVRFR